MQAAAEVCLAVSTLCTSRFEILISLCTFAAVAGKKLKVGLPCTCKPAYTPEFTHANQDKREFSLVVLHGGSSARPSPEANIPNPKQPKLPL